MWHASGLRQQIDSMQAVLCKTWGDRTPNCRRQGRDRGTAFLGRDTVVPPLALVVCYGMVLEFSAASRSRQTEPACRALVSLPRSAAPRSHLLSTAV
ncbi:hypothetical protein Y032_0035g3137 [Ancylostoma ceylanicum]|uniref:Uncharacterized protein n=1 Tax=Ancylostoma ceylanicum TaxID=53326 RepID=A0A016ULP5_9BILA|nr:hypothetical protein Y032_0035g3137 [Ancylostoma ceylanicum]